MNSYYLFSNNSIFSFLERSIRTNQHYSPKKKPTLFLQHNTEQPSRMPFFYNTKILYFQFGFPNKQINVQSNMKFIV